MEADAPTETTQYRNSRVHRHPATPAAARPAPGLLQLPCFQNILGPALEHDNSACVPRQLTQFDSRATVKLVDATTRPKRRRRPWSSRDDGHAFFYRKQDQFWSLTTEMWATRRGGACRHADCRSVTVPACACRRTSASPSWRKRLWQGCPERTLFSARKP